MSSSSPTARLKRTISFSSLSILTPTGSPVTPPVSATSSPMLPPLAPLLKEKDFLHPNITQAPYRPPYVDNSPLTRILLEQENNRREVERELQRERDLARAERDKAKESLAEMEERVKTIMEKCTRTIAEAKRVLRVASPIYKSLPQHTRTKMRLRACAALKQAVEEIDGGKA